MTALAMVDWDELTAAECSALVTDPDMTFEVGAQLLTPDLSVLGGLSVRPSGNVHWLGAATVHRDASFTLLDELSWGTALVRLRSSLTSAALGLSAIRDVGAFRTQTPEDQLGELTLNDAGLWVPSWVVTGQDRLYALNRQVGRSYVVTAGTSVTDAIAQAYTDAGVTGFLIDSSASDVFVPVAMAWPLIPATDTASTDDSGDSTDSGPTTWLRIVNDLHALVNYAGCWADEHGFYRSTPYVDPGQRPSRFAFDATDIMRSPVGMSRSRAQDMYDIPNKWSFIRDNMPDGVVPADGAGIYQFTNTDDGPSSVNQRNGEVWPTQIALSAADQATLEALGNARIAADKRGLTTFTVPTAPWPCASHYDVFTYCEARFGTVTVEAQEWTMPLDGTDVSWVWQAI